MAFIDEPLDGGLVTSQDPTTLQQGELAGALNGFYAPKSKVIQRAPGWSEVVATAASATAAYTGMLGCYMPHNDTNYILVQKYEDGILASGDAATVSPLATLHTATTTGATGLGGTVYNGKWYLFNGLENRVFCASGTGVQTRPHGMAPTTSEFLATATAALAPSVTATGFYEYWYTEVAKYNNGSDEIEGTYSGAKATTVSVTSLSTSAPTFTFPGFINSNAVAYRLYRSSSTKAAATDTLYPDGVFVKDVEPSQTTAQTTAVDGGTPGTVTGNMTIVDSYNHPGWATASGTASTGGASGAFVTGGSEAYWNYKATRDSSLGSGKAWGGMFYTPSFGSSVTGTIAGLQLDIKIKSSHPERFQVKAYIGLRDTATRVGPDESHGLTDLPAKVSNPTGIIGPKMTADGIVSRLYAAYPSKAVNMSTVSSTYSTATLGGTYDDWLPSDYDWTAGDLNNSGMAIMITITPKNSPNAPADTNWVAIDGITLSVFQSGNNATVGSPYDVISVDVGGTAINSGSHGKPPTATCGTMFEGSLVTNNVDKPGLIQYSMPGFPDYFPSLYQIMLPPGGGDRTITYIGVVNNRLIVCTNNAIYRVNYLPNEDDASFSRGRAIEVVSTIYGCLRPSVGCVISTETGLEELLLASSAGVAGTDGYSTKLMSVDVVWENYAEGIFHSNIPVNAQNCIALVNHPATQSARLFTRKFEGDDAHGGYWQISYAPQHRKAAGVKWAGPVEVTTNEARSVSCAAVVPQSDGTFRLYVATYEDGGGGSLSGIACSIAKETLTDEGTLPSGNGMQLVTRIIPLAGEGNEAAVDGIFIYGKKHDGLGSVASPDVTLNAKQFYANAAFNNAYTATTTSVVNARAAYVPVGGVNCSGLQLTVTQDDATPLDLVKLVMSGSNFGPEEAF